MGKKKSALWVLISELYGVQIAIQMVLAFLAGLQIAAWLAEFFPTEYQIIAFLSITFVGAIGAMIVLQAIMEIPSFLMSFIRGICRR